MLPPRRPRNVRVARESDAREVRAIYAPFVESSHTSFELEVPAVEEIARRISLTLETHPWLVLEESSGGVLAYAYASTHRARAAYQWSAEVSVYVADSARRSGAGSAVYRALFALLARQGFYNAFAGIALPNNASILLHESLGFEKVGTYEKIGFKNGVWSDVGWWQLALRPRDVPSGPPVLFAKLDKSEVEDILLAAC